LAARALGKMQFASSAQSELAIDVLGVGADGLDADVQIVRDLHIGASPPQVLDYFCLARGERCTGNG
jgi:hypothetical protein